MDHVEYNKEITGDSDMEAFIQSDISLAVRRNQAERRRPCKSL